VAPAACDKLSPQELERYARHLAIPDIGESGQRKLKAARVLVVGLGGLGSPVALYLAAAGVGTLGIVDPDAVSLSNLQRQILYGERDIGRPKTVAAQERLSDLNSFVRVRTHPLRFVGREATCLAGDYDILVDGTDNFETRYLINDVALERGIPYAYGAVFQLEGQAALLCTSGAPCYRCLFPSPPPPETVRPAEETGILGVVPGIIGLLQATLVIRWVTAYATSVPNRLVVYDARRIELLSIAVDPNPNCPACGPR
jgi:molybdopterin/thiamine biosynthesis adenylyltransferase